MGYFLNCFGDSNQKRCRKSKKTTISSHPKQEDCKVLQISASKDQQIVEEPINPIAESKDAHEKKSDFNIKKKVTFDLNVKTYDVYSSQEDAKILIENNEEKEREITEQEEQKESKTPSDAITILYPENHRYHDCLKGDVDDEFFDSDENDLDDKKGETEELKTGETRETKLVIEELSESLFSLSIESSTKVGAGKLDDREVNSPIPEQNLVNLESKSNAIQISEDGNRNQFIHEESLFSSSVESRTNDDGDESEDREVNSPTLKQNLIKMDSKSNGSIQISRYGNQSQTVDDLLNPVENLSPWKSVKETAKPPPKSQNVMSFEKENINTDKEFAIPFSVVEPSFKTNCNQQKFNKEIGVDTSLSSWLLESENDTPMSELSTNSVGNSPNEMENSLKSTPVSKNSLRSYEDRPILGH
ncbi:hypothetical protein RJ641_020442 [Dillenia turbinata]|uniref:Uncharacterized protein n=1 Tax=Dillenia turbinata TaxID=194707 RepID=A0AAN8UGZ5_9MAGN